ncbi:5-formyltetrahydrofolate cyclo-ligase [Gilvimarinus sp. DA14]|uniref:5-formyltetrahydrofolate cyclo-ligase n=1 Tax=Gilvimarinus sp. DA14 TaxID=2956798 RepID=UPI0020B7B8E4|nr:5-formyltetrahydrofolate cyclo-ligase [Gilvimarinus sp. DA14]UTF59236.1 5-formyltetrahydrofolate cyclo-ligase [Gilvimarinus sp. DA14]
MTQSRQLLRRQLRQRRRSLPPSAQRRAGQALIQQLQNHPWLTNTKKVALYWPADGELDPRPLAKRLWRAGVKCYLPVLHPWQKRQLWFTPFTPATRFRRNRFGIAEPIAHQSAPLSARHLDLVLTPLVGFDRTGGRLGMGGGFYDTTFAFKRRTPGHSKPKLIGLAHSCQEVEKLPLEPWDIPLDAVVTEREVIVGRRRSDAERLSRSHPLSNPKHGS